MEIYIRRARPSDAASIAAVEVTSWRAAYRGLMPDPFLAQICQAEKTEVWHKNLLKHGTTGRKRAIIALKGDRILGFVRVGVPEDTEAVGLVYLLYVLPKEWGHGVGTVLMHAAMDELHDLGMREATLWVLRDNSRARAFYENLGWYPDGQTITTEYGGVDLEALCYRRTVCGLGFEFVD